MPKIAILTDSTPSNSLVWNRLRLVVPTCDIDGPWPPEDYGVQGVQGMPDLVLVDACATHAAPSESRLFKLRRLQPWCPWVVVGRAESLQIACHIGANDVWLPDHLPHSGDAAEDADAWAFLVAKTRQNRLNETLDPGYASLPGLQRTVLWYAHQGFTNSAIAAIVSLSIDSVKSMLSRAYAAGAPRRSAKGTRGPIVDNS